MSTALIVLAIFVCFSLTTFWMFKHQCKPCCQFTFRGFPRMNDVELVEEVGQVTCKGDFFIKCDKNANPFSAFEIYRIDDVRSNINGEIWVQYTTPVVTQDYEIVCDTQCERLQTFLVGKQKVRPIEHSQTLFGKLKTTMDEVN